MRQLFRYLRPANPSMNSPISKLAIFYARFTLADLCARACAHRQCAGNRLNNEVVLDVAPEMIMLLWLRYTRVPRKSCISLCRAHLDRQIRVFARHEICAWNFCILELDCISFDFIFVFLLYVHEFMLVGCYLHRSCVFIGFRLLLFRLISIITMHLRCFDTQMETLSSRNLRNLHRFSTCRFFVCCFFRILLIQLFQRNVQRKMKIATQCNSWEFRFPIRIWLDISMVIGERSAFHCASRWPHDFISLCKMPSCSTIPKSSRDAKFVGFSKWSRCLQACIYVK